MKGVKRKDYLSDSTNNQCFCLSSSNFPDYQNHHCTSPNFFGKIWSWALNRIHYTVKSCNQMLNFREHVYLHIKKMSLKRLPTASNLHVKRRKCIQEISIYSCKFKCLISIYSFKFKCLVLSLWS